MPTEIPVDAPKPRLCRLRKWSDFNGYGFNLHADKGKEGQYVGSVDPNSPAELAGLMKGDRIIEVNGINIGVENHQQVVNRIKTNPNEATLLVVSPDGAEYYKRLNIVIDSNMSNLRVRETPASNPFTASSFNKNMYSDYSSMDTGYSLRSCLLSLWQDFQGYGFNLQSLDGKPGQYVGSIDRNSPAQLGGLKERDRLILVNDIDVTNMNHKDVVMLIKSNKNSVALLVVDPEADRYFSSSGVKLPNDQVHVIDCKGPLSNPYVGKSSSQNGCSNNNNNSNNIAISTPELKNVKLETAIVSETNEQQQPHQQQQPHCQDLQQEQQRQPNDHHYQDHHQQEQQQQQNQEDDYHDNEQQHQQLHDTHEEQKSFNHLDQDFYLTEHQQQLGSIDSSSICERENSTHSISSIDAGRNASQRSYKSAEYDASSAPSSAKPSPSLSPLASLALSSPPPIQPSSSSVNQLLSPSASTHSYSSLSPSPNSLIFAGSAKEARERMSRKKNVKDVSMTLKDKYDLLQKL
ncbi:hypothetical protein HELRODRAFT_193300 [Helobdella robusta]|uniref:PDZ domain-containing protein n=1 Tax=Helobdella robusta TaxID=6412 RepID=T1FUU9_HELRO|nr:hypothetical protein HELRODRAFT_193300 [Helobdella robusta]ESN97203.1 hypothetical protein HELRODRAFT_193300 [Helobdella robusta]